MPVLPGDTVETLHERIKAVERRLYPGTIRAIVERESRSCREGPALRLRQDRRGRPGPRPGRPRLGAGLQRRHGAGPAPRPASPVTDVADRHRRPGDARRPGEDPAPQGPRRHPRRPRRPEHLADLERHGIEPIDLVVVATSTRSASDPSRRADRHRRPDHGAGGGQEPRPRRRRRRPGRLRRRCSTSSGADGALSAATRRRLARAAFAHTAAYDAAIVGWLDDDRHEPTTAAAHPPPRPRAGARTCATARTRTSGRPLPHASAPTALVGRRRSSTPAWRCRTSTSTTPTPPGALVHDLGDRPGGCAIIKHANPCGVAVADDLATAYRLAFECDELSAFGGIVALNRPVDDATVERDGGRRPGRRRHRPRLRRRRRRRPAGQAQEHPAARGAAAGAPTPCHLRQITGGFLVQEPPPLRRRPRRLAGRHQGGAHRRAVADAELAWRRVRPRQVERRSCW